MSKSVNVAKSRLSVGFTNNNQKFSDFWNKSKVFDKANESLSGNLFVLLDGPPYANGDAHLGHGLNKLLKGLVVKSRWFMGQPVKYQPGWDCHGLPLELLVEKKYGKLPLLDLKKKCKTLAFKSLVKQRKTFKSLGVLGDWNNPYLTLSQGMLQETWKSLANLFEKDLLEYKQFPVHYCPACASSLAEAELELKDLPKDSLYFKMKLSHKDNLYALVWTTTPWTLPMNQGLAYNSDFEYELWKNEDNELLLLQNSSQKEVGSWLERNNFNFVKLTKFDFFNVNEAVSPLTKNVVPVVHADFVEEGKTGFVHLSFSHGPEDYELGQSLNLSPYSYLNKNGVFENLPPSLDQLNNKKYNQVSELVCSLLGSDKVNYFSENVEQQVCWRHKCGVYYNATYQVFLKLNSPTYNLKDKVATLLHEGNLANNVATRLSTMLLGRNHWCLSRQRQWGCPMNLLVDKNTNKLSEKTVDYLNFHANNDSVGANKLLNDNKNLLVFTDVLDVWFDSGNVVNQYFSMNGSQAEKYVVDLVVEGKDQYRGWFQSLLWLSVAVNNKLPYSNVLCHGFVLNQNRQKLSKSKGDGGELEKYLSQYGSDTLNLWVASQETELDAVFSESKLEEMKNTYSRLRLSLRFLTSNLYDYEYKNHDLLLNNFKDKSSFDLHRYAMVEMYNLYNEVYGYLQDYKFKKALDSVYTFCEKVLSNFYFEVVKNTLYLRNVNSEKRLMAQVCMFELLNGLLEFTKVFVPFASEEFYQDFYGESSESVFCVHYFTSKKLDFLSQLNLSYDWTKVVSKRKEVLASLEPYQKNKVLKSRTEAKVSLFTNDPMYLLLEKDFDLKELFSVSEVKLLSGLDDVLVEDLKDNANYCKCNRCWNYSLFKNFNNDNCLECQND